MSFQANYEKLCHSLEDQLSAVKTKNDENTRLITEMNAQRERLQNENGVNLCPGFLTDSCFTVQHCLTLLYMLAFLFLFDQVSFLVSLRRKRQC